MHPASRESRSAGPGCGFQPLPPRHTHSLAAPDTPTHWPPRIHPLTGHPGHTHSLAAPDTPTHWPPQPHPFSVTTGSRLVASASPLSGIKSFRVFFSTFPLTTGKSTSIHRTRDTDKFRSYGKVCFLLKYRHLGSWFLVTISHWTMFSWRQSLYAVPQLLSLCSFPRTGGGGAGLHRACRKLIYTSETLLVWSFLAAHSV